MPPVLVPRITPTRDGPWRRIASSMASRIWSTAAHMSLLLRQSWRAADVFRQADRHEVGQHSNRRDDRRQTWRALIADTILRPGDSHNALPEHVLRHEEELPRLEAQPNLDQNRVAVAAHCHQLDGL